MITYFRGFKGSAAHLGKGKGCAGGQYPLTWSYSMSSLRCSKPASASKKSGLSTPSSSGVTPVNPRRVRLGPRLSTVASQLGHSHPQRPTVGLVEALSAASSTIGPPKVRLGAAPPRTPLDEGLQESCCSGVVRIDPIPLQFSCSDGLCNGFSRSGIKIIN